MDTKVAKLALGLAAATLALSVVFGYAPSRAQDMPGAPTPPPATNNPDQWAPPPPGLNAPPSYGGPVYSCTGVGAPPEPGVPPCPPGMSSISKPLPPAAEGFKRLQQINKEMPPHEVDPFHRHPPPPRPDPRIEAWMNSPAYKAWAKTHIFSGPIMWNCGLSYPGHNWLSPTKEGCAAATPPAGSIIPPQGIHTAGSP
jgi:hypothetical protein